jgi:enoyl-[acyl-carrier protein] reductase I
MYFMTQTLAGKKGLIVGIANDRSLAWGCAQAFRTEGAELAVTYLNDKAKLFVEPLAKQVQASVILPLRVENDDQMNVLFSAITQKWGKLDFLLHSIAYSPGADLRGRVVDCSREGFLSAMDISCHSFMRMAKLAEPLMKDGGALLTMSYLGAERVVPHYNLMGPVKAALESTVKYLAAELGSKHIRVNALSPGPILTRAATGIPGFAELAEESARKSPCPGILSIEEVGAFAAFLVGDAARHITGNIEYIDGGRNIMS